MLLLFLCYMWRMCNRYHSHILRRCVWAHTINTECLSGLVELYGMRVVYAVDFMHTFHDGEEAQT